MSRWAPERGSRVQDASEHAGALRERVKRAVQGAGPGMADARVTPVLEAALEAAYTAGVREGRSAQAAEAQNRLNARLAKALEGIFLPPAICPHCDRGSADQASCSECEGTGNRAC